MLRCSSMMRHGYYHGTGVCFHVAGEGAADSKSLNLWSANK
jgi:hypothetical protein